MTAVDGILTGYLQRLERASADLPEDRREELLAGIREHLWEARATGAVRDEASALTVLDRLGTPEEIAGAAREEGPPVGGAVPVAIRPAGTGLELTAVLLLTLGSLVPLVGWLAGVGLLWFSDRWRVREKVLGTLVVPLGPGVALWGSALLPFGRSETCIGAPVRAGPGPADGQVPLPGVERAPFPGSADQAMTCTVTGPPEWVAPVALVVVAVAPLVVAAVLLRIARRRAAAEPPVLVPAAESADGPWGALEIVAVLVLGLGGFLAPVVGPLAGLALVYCSTRWRPWEKAVATGLSGLPLLAVVLPLLLARSSL